MCFVTVRTVEASRELLTHYGEGYAPIRERKQYEVTDEPFPTSGAAEVDAALRRFAKAQNRTVRDIACTLGHQECGVHRRQDREERAAHRRCRTHQRGGVCRAVWDNRHRCGRTGAAGCGRSHERWAALQGTRYPRRLT